MAEQTFTSGQILTAAQMTTLQTNTGLAWISSTAVPASPAQSSIVVSGCFTSTYDNYRIIYAGGAMSSNQRFSMILGASTAGYYEGLNFVTYATGAAGSTATNNGPAWVLIGGGSTQSTGFIIDLQNPFLAQYTQMNAVGSLQTTQATWDQGIHAVATSYTGFTITPIGSTITGGTLSIYGYRK